jgi:uncharacterized GH25 family protein
MLVACGGASAIAHEFWIQPATFQIEPGQSLAVGLEVGDGMPGESVARNPNKIARFEALGPASVAGNAQSQSNAPAQATPINGRPGADPAGTVTLHEPGTSILVYRSNHSRVELQPAQFEFYLREDGLEHIIAARSERAQTDQPGREAYSRSCKALVQVRAKDAADVTTARPQDRVVGLHHELVLLDIIDTDPTTPGVTLHIRDLFAGESLANANVCVRSPDHPGEKLCTRTDAAGEAKIDVTWTGMLLVSAVHMVEAPAKVVAMDKVEWESTWASLTFEMPAAAQHQPASGTK